jgi:uncharacterized protein YggE
VKTLSAGAFLLAIVSGCSPVAAQTGAVTTSSAIPTIHAAGEGRREAMPDKATIMFGVETRATNPAAAGAANADRMTTIRAALRQAGVPDSAIRTSRYSVHLQMGPTESHPTPVATNFITVDTGRLDEMGRLIDTALGAGATNIGSLQYALIDRSELERLALAEAVAAARRQAEVMAQAAGGRLGELLDLGTQSGQYRPVFEQDASFRMAASAAPTPISPGSVTVTATVTARWRFIPGR